MWERSLDYKDIKWTEIHMLNLKVGKNDQAIKSLKTGQCDKENFANGSNADSLKI